MNKDIDRSAVNPVLQGDYPDPSVVRVGNDYYMVSSTFQYFPAVVVLHSRNLVDWQTIGHVITRKEQLDLTGMPDSFGVFAPDISYSDGKYWVVVPFFHGQPRCTNILYTSDRPEGPYSNGTVLNHHFIDPSIFHDEDGRRYLVCGGGWLQELARNGSRVIGKPKQVWPGTGGAAPEAPHLLKKDGWYYLMLAEGGTFFDHMATAARSRTIWGPYEPCPHNPVLKQQDSNGQIQKAGHGKLVQAIDGRWWMFHLGGRPLTPLGNCPLGRETFLEAVHWTDDGWFQVGEQGSPQQTIPLAAAEARGSASDLVVDTFSERSLSPEWEWVRLPVVGGYELDDHGLTLHCRPYLLLSPQNTLILTRRWRHFNFIAETELELWPETLGEEAGMMLYRDLDAFLLFTIRKGIGPQSGQHFDVKRLYEQQDFDGLFLQIERCEKAMKTIVAQYPLNLEMGMPVRLRLTVEDDGRTARFAWVQAEKQETVSIGACSAEFLFPEYAARFQCFTAPRIALMARGVYGTKHGRATFKQFSYEGINMDG